MNDEQSRLISQDLISADGEGERVHVLIKWLPELVRCQIKTASRTKRLCEEMKKAEGDVARYERMTEQTVQALQTLSERVTALHASPSWKHDKAGWLKSNWQWLVLFLLLLKQNGLGELLESVVRLVHHS